MKVHGRFRGNSEGGAVVWLLILIVVAALAYVVWQKISPPKPKPQIVEVATPVPATPLPATPEPVKATPTPLPVAVATPTPAPIPTPPSLDLATVTRNPSLWPTQILLVQPVTLPVELNGRVVGEAKVPAGTGVRVLRVLNPQVEIQYQNARYVIPVASTDLMARALATFRSNGSMLPQATPAAASTTSVVTAPTASGTPTPAAAEKFNVGVTADRKRVDMERAAPVGVGTESKSSEKCLYTLTVQNRTRGDVPPLDVQYVVFVERQKLGRKKDSDTVERVAGTAKTAALSLKTLSQSVSTSEIELWKRNLTGGYVYIGGGRLKVEDNVLGIWVKVFHEGQLLTEYINPSTISKRGWEEK